MTDALRRLTPQTVAGQLTTVVIAAVLVGIGLASAVMFYLVYSGGVGPSHETMVQVRAARIAAVVNGVKQARSLSDAAYITKHANSDPVYVSWAKAPPPESADGPPPSAMIRDIEQDLQKGWRLQTLPHARTGTDADSIYVRPDDTHVLRFTIRPFGSIGSLVLTQTLCTLAVITFLIVFVSAYAVRWVTAPLTSIASAARASIST